MRAHDPSQHHCLCYSSRPSMYSPLFFFHPLEVGGNLRSFSLTLAHDFVLLIESRGFYRWRGTTFPFLRFSIIFVPVFRL